MDSTEHIISSPGTASKNERARPGRDRDNLPLEGVGSAPRAASWQSLPNASTSRDGSDSGASSPVVRKPATQSKLNELRTRISGFEKQLEDETRVRKESEEQRINGMRDSVLNLEKTLTAEVKRRVDANKTLQSMFENQITNCYEKMEGDFMAKLDQLRTATNKLNDRLTVVEDDLQQTGLLTSVEEKCALVSREVTALQGIIEAESGARQTKEAAATKHLATLDHTLETKLAGERAQRERNFNTIREELEELREARTDEEEKFQNFTLEEIAMLKNTLLEEAKTREQADDDIVQALNHYTDAFQDSLRIVNSA